MIYITIIVLAFLAMVILFFIATERKHSRIKAEQKAEAIKNAEEQLRKARLENPSDVLLHLTLRENLVRLRNEK